MTLLDNELVRKYFPCQCAPLRPANEQLECRANQVLKAMQQPIKAGDRIIRVWHSTDAKMEIVYIDEGIADREHDWHPDWLRLPDRFQKQEYCKTHHEWEWMCRQCGFKQPPPSPEKCSHDGSFKAVALCPKCNPQPKDEVEEKVEKLCQFFVVDKSPESFKEELRELVELARKTK